MNALERMQALAGNDYAVSLEDGFVVARFVADGDHHWLSFDAADAEPAKRTSCLDWSVRTAMGQDVPMPKWMAAVGLDVAVDVDANG